MSYGKIGSTTVAVTQDLLSGIPFVLKIELICIWNSILSEPGQPSAQLSELICLTACNKAMHAISWWYRTVHIPWLVTSYDTHKSERWLNSDPPNHRVPLLRWPFRYFLFVSRCLVSRENLASISWSTSASEIFLFCPWGLRVLLSGVVLTPIFDTVGLDGLKGRAYVFLLSLLHAPFFLLLFSLSLLSFYMLHGIVELGSSDW